jgi:hypothetical protein
VKPHSGSSSGTASPPSQKPVFMNVTTCMDEVCRACYALTGTATDVPVTLLMFVRFVDNPQTPECVRPNCDCSTVTKGTKYGYRGNAFSIGVDATQDECRVAWVL